MMSDGRSLLSTWQNNTDVNDFIMKQAGIQTATSYRNYLRTHGPEIQDQHRKESCNDSGYTSMGINTMAARVATTGSLASSLYEEDTVLNSVSSGSTVTFTDNSDLRSVYLTKEQLYMARERIPNLTSAEVQTFLSQQKGAVPTPGAAKRGVQW